MIRNYAIAYSAFTFRIFVGLYLAFEKKDIIYQLGIYFSIIINVLGGELVIYMKNRKKQDRKLLLEENEEEEEEGIKNTNQESFNSNNSIEE